MKKSYISFLATISIMTTEGFVVKRQATPVTKTRTTTSSLWLSAYNNDPEGNKSSNNKNKNNNNNNLAFNPFDGYQAVDVNRAKECAENFGQCTTTEMEQLRNNLHKERLQSFIFGGTKETMEHFVLEEELDVQLALLKDHDTAIENPVLFPQEMETILPHIYDDPVVDDMEGEEKKKKKMENDNPILGHIHAPTPMEVLAIEETVLEENTLEAILFCAVLAAFMILPQLAGTM